MVEKQIRQIKETFIASVDLEKSFDNVQWNTLFKIVKRISLNILTEDLSIICIKQNSLNTDRWE